MVKNILKVSFLLSVVGVLLVGCSSKTNLKSYDPVMEEERAAGPMLHLGCNDSRQIDSVRVEEQPRHKNTSSLILNVNSYYDEGFEQGQEDGYNDGVENLRGDSYDDSCRYRGKNRKEYELGYEEGYDTGFDDGFADSGIDSEYEE